MVKVTLESKSKKLPNVSIVAMKRNPSTGRIVNQEWWTAASFANLASDLVEVHTFDRVIDVYDASSIPKWVQWVLGKPLKMRTSTFLKENYKKSFKEAIQCRLDEDLN